MIKFIIKCLLRKAKSQYEKHLKAQKRLMTEIKDDRILLAKLGYLDVLNNNTVLHHLMHLYAAYDYHSKQLAVYDKLYMELKRLK
jgi:hypothetical protein